MHKDFAREYFDLQLKELEAESRYRVDRKGDFLCVVTVQAGKYLPAFRVQADGFDLEPPLIEFADPSTGERLNDSRWPQGKSIASGNALFPGPIICVTGNRTYHTHSSHLGEPFHHFRNLFTLKAFLDRLTSSIADGSTTMQSTGGVYNV